MALHLSAGREILGEVPGLFIVELHGESLERGVLDAEVAAAAVDVLRVCTEGKDGMSL